MTETRDASRRWIALWALPNLSLQQAIRYPQIGLFRPGDDELRETASDAEGLRTLLGAFADEFGKPVEPALIAYARDAFEKLPPVSAISGFRDAVCISTLTRSHAIFAINKQSLSILFSDALDFYPWLLAKGDGKNIYADNPSMIGLHKLSALRPQPTPAFSRRRLSASDFDEPLLDAIFARWVSHFVEDTQLSEDRRLFRALDAARSAARMPGGADASILDAGRSLSLWVSAFEILVHDGKSSARHVLDHLAKGEWQFRELAAFDRSARCGGKSVTTNAAGEIYLALNKARNDFVHGNPVSAEALKYRASGRFVQSFAPSLFRIALAIHLGVRFEKPMPDMHADPEGAGAWIAERMTFEAPQKLAERALLVAEATASTDNDNHDDE